MLKDPNVERVIKRYTEPLQKQISMMQIELEALKEQCNIANVVKSLPNDDEIEEAANENADRIFGDDIGSNTEWYAMHNGFTDGVEWLKNHLNK